MIALNRMGKFKVQSSFSHLRSRLSTRSAYQLVSVALAAVLLLSNCMLASGELTSIDTPQDAGNVSTSFVSAEGSDTRSITTSAAGKLNVITIVSADQGVLTIELLDSSGAVVYAVSSRPQTPVTKSGDVSTDVQGRLRYRVRATGARNGSFQILYQRISS